MKLIKEILNEVKAIANDIKENEEKINHHGKRADAIVKGMLQHSAKQAADKKNQQILMHWLMNIYDWLIMVFVQKTNHSMQHMKTDFDESIGKINIIPQDIGRVILEFDQQCFLCSG